MAAAVILIWGEIMASVLVIVKFTASEKGARNIARTRVCLEFAVECLGPSWGERSVFWNE